MTKAKTLKILFVCILAFSAISAIACHVFGWIDLYTSARLIVIPAFLLIVLIGLMDKEFGKIILRGWLYGLLAVSIYDLSRIPFMMAGWGDFIPTIGDWVMGTENVHPLVGYAWRYIGNGGGLGIAFVVITTYFPIKVNKLLIGLIYGLCVWLCLDIVLIYSDHGQDMMFQLTSLNVTGSLIGHVVYGSVLGALIYWKSLGLEDTFEKLPTNPG